MSHAAPEQRPALARAHAKNRGIALIMVIFMMAIASAILISLSDSTYIAMRLNGAAEQRVKAEYILKSALNVSQVLIKNDLTAFDDPTQDAWMQFVDGREVPGELLALPDPGVRVSLLIASLNGKVPILNVYSSGQVKADWRDIVIRLFQQLGFDRPDPMNVDREGRALPDSKQLIANLIDYLDTDEESFPSDGVLPQGVEGDLPNGQKFRNSGTIDSIANELSTIPGFSPARVQKLLPFVTKTRFNDINVNAAPLEVLSAVLTDTTTAQSILQCRDPQQGGMPIQDPQQELQTRCGVTDPNLSKFRGQGQYFEIIAKVEYGTAVFMASGELATNGRTGRLPKVVNFQMY